MVMLLIASSLRAKTLDDSQIDYLERLFDSFLESASTLSATDFQSSLKRFSITLFESIFAAVCSDAFRGRETVAGKIDPQSVTMLREDPEFLSAAERATTGRSNVQTRLER